MNYRYYRSEITGTTGPSRFSADMNYRYYRSETGTTGGWRRKAQFCVKINYRYYRSLTDTTGRDRYYRWSLTGRCLFRI
jgi:hypothetical protein